MRTLFKTTFALLIAISLSSCASLFTSTKYDVRFQSDPSNADIVITDTKKGHDVFIGKTPAIISLKSSAGFFSKANYSVKISFPGYEPYETTISANIEGWYFGNILLGGLIGMLIIDPATGAMWKIDREIVTVRLVPEASNMKQALQILSIDQIPDDIREKMIRIN